MVAGEGTTRFIGWAIVTALSIVLLLISIRNGLGVDDVPAILGTIVGGFKSFFSFFGGSKGASASMRRPMVATAPPQQYQIMGSFFGRRK